GNVFVVETTSLLSFNRSDLFEFTGNISGDGQIAQIGDGTTVLTSTENDIGAARVDNGTLRVAGGLTTATVAMNGDGHLHVTGTVGAAGGAQTLITGDNGASAVQVDAGGTLRANGSLG